MKQLARRGAVAGMALGIVVLAALALRLMQVEGAGVRAIVAVWLWLLPVTGVCGLAGWLLGSGIERLGARR